MTHYVSKKYAQCFYKTYVHITLKWRIARRHVVMGNDAWHAPNLLMGSFAWMAKAKHTIGDVERF